MRVVLRWLVSVILGTVSYVLFDFLYSIEELNLISLAPRYVSIIVGVIFTFISYFIVSNFIVGLIFRILNSVEDRMTKMNVRELLLSSTGMIIGLITANLLSLTFYKYDIVGTPLTVSLNVVLGYLGFRVAQSKKEDFQMPALFSFSALKEKKNSSSGKPKILDTSVIIDGRIIDILQTGFIEGKILIPDFILQELRHIADSSDNLKRNRGRRGLDILNAIQKQLKVPVEIVEGSKDDNSEVDIKLLNMAKKMNAYVVTNDFNLNKVADFQGVLVLNINELSNAVKPVLLPGEELEVQIIKDGKENGQGVGYLNDGTMIVVEGGNRFIGETIDVSVTSVLQTAAGRMIFTRKKEAS